MIQVKFDLCVHYDNIMVYTCEHEATYIMKMNLFFKAYLCLLGKGVHVQKCPESTSAVRSLAGPHDLSCSSS